MDKLNMFITFYQSLFAYFLIFRRCFPYRNLFNTWLTKEYSLIKGFLKWFEREIGAEVDTIANPPFAPRLLTGQKPTFPRIFAQRKAPICFWCLWCGI